MSTHPFLKPLLLALLFASSWSSPLRAQSPWAISQDTSLSFQEIVEAVQPHFDSLRTANGGQMTHEEKLFQRWISFWSSRVDVSNGKVGGSTSVAQAYHLAQAQGEFPICDQSVGNGSWSLVGPERMASWQQNMGIVNALAQHPTDTMILYAGCNFSGLWKSTDGGGSWRCVTDILRLPLLPVHTILIDPANPDIVFIGTGRTEHNAVRFGLGVFKSTNGGNTWTHLGPTPGVTYSAPAEVDVLRMHPVNHNILLAAGQKHIHRSTDGGLHWTLVLGDTQTGKVLGSDEFVDMEVCPSNPNVWLASTRESVGHPANNPQSFTAALYRSIDAGQTWTCVNCWNPAPAPFAHNERLMISATAPDGYLYVAHSIYQANANLKVNIVKTNDGMSFQPVSLAEIPIGGPWFETFVFDASPTVPGRFYIGGRELYHKDGPNVGWSPYGPPIMHPDMRDLMVRVGPGNQDRILLATDGGILASKNSGNTWYDKNGSNLAITQFYGIDLHPSTGMVVGGAQDVGTWRSGGPGAPWIEVIAREDGGWVEIHDLDEAVTAFGNISGWRNVWDNFGSIVGPANQMGVPGPQVDVMMDRKITGDPRVPGKYWSGDDRLIKSIQADHANATWSPTVFTRPFTSKPHHFADIAISPSNPKVFYWAYTDPCYKADSVSRVFFRSLDGMATSEDITRNLRPSPGSTVMIYQWQSVTDLEVDPNNPAHVMAGATGYGWNAGLSQATSRVFESYDYGDTWNDISNGLPPFPVNHLCMQNGTGGITYAATDGGVFRFNPATRVWECFNKDLPAARCSRVVIDYCREKILVGTFGRGVWEAPLAPVGDYHVAFSQTWDAGYVQSFTNNVVVDPGVTLTIKGTVKFAAGKRLVVKKGAKVALIGGKLTTACNILWAGVDVWGSTTLPQVLGANGLDPNHGVLLVAAGGTIENAAVGVMTSAHDSQGNIYWGSFGGIVQCVDAKFLNNKVDVIMMPHMRTNLSYFRSSLFETTRKLNTGANPVVHLSMWNVRNIPVVACTFRYSAGNAYADSQRGIGISGRDASYFVDWKCTASNQTGCIAGVSTTFENLTYGVEHASTNRLLSPAVRHSSFLGNRVCGIKLTTADFAAIEDNYFMVGHNAGSLAPSIGIYTDQCTRYSIQNNRLRGTGANTYGMVINASGDDHNDVYNNDFDDLRYCISAQGDNEGPSTGDGLVMNCNDFGRGATYAIVVSGVGVGDQQGYYVGTIAQQRLALVRNRYFPNCTANSENKFFVQNIPQNPIVHHAGQEVYCQTLPQPDCSNGLEVQSTVDLRPGLNFDKLEQCPNNAGASLPEINARLSESRVRLAEAKRNYEEMITNESSKAFLGRLATLSSPEEREEFIFLHAPFLSRSELSLVLQSAKSFSMAKVEDILIANSSLVSELDSIVGALNLPKSTLSRIMMSQSGDSQEQKQLAEISFEMSTLTYWQTEAIRYWIHDTLHGSPLDSLKFALEREAMDRCRQMELILAVDPNQFQVYPSLPDFRCNLPDLVVDSIAIRLYEEAKSCIDFETKVTRMPEKESFTVLPPCFPAAENLIWGLLGTMDKEQLFQIPSIGGVSNSSDGGKEPHRCKLCRIGRKKTTYD